MLSGRTAPRRRGAIRPKQRNELRATKKKARHVPGFFLAGCRGHNPQKQYASDFTGTPRVGWIALCRKRRSCAACGIARGSSTCAMPCTKSDFCSQYAPTLLPAKLEKNCENGGASFSM